jgi:hypothetical protein
MSNRDTLRQGGYSVDDAGRIQCQREGTRYEQERCAVIRVDLEPDSKRGRELVDAVVAAADTPRALLGRARNGSAVLLFRCENPHNLVPHIQGRISTNGIFELATRDTGERFTVTIASEGQTLDLNGYSWPKGRSPLEISRDSLPNLTSDVGEVVLKAAFESATWAPSAEEIQTEAEREERVAHFKADVASGKIRLNKTEAELLAEEDAKLVEGASADLTPHDGIFAQLVIAARRRIERRKADAA